jgi:hypothetical protein
MKLRYWLLLIFVMSIFNLYFGIKFSNSNYIEVDRANCWSSQSNSYTDNISHHHNNNLKFFILKNS